jgi:ubiquitin-conjugating enzyme E2 Q
MELLTASGWSPACNFESLLVQVVMAFVEGEGRLDLKVSVHGKHEYQESEAREAFQRAARAHGWKTS